VVAVWVRWRTGQLSHARTDGQSVGNRFLRSAGCSQPFLETRQLGVCSSSRKSQMKRIAQSRCEVACNGNERWSGESRTRNGCAGLLHDCVTAGLRRGSRSGRPADTRRDTHAVRSASFFSGKDPRKHVALSVAPWGARGDRLDRSTPPARRTRSSSSRRTTMGQFMPGELQLRGPRR